MIFSLLNIVFAKYLMLWYALEFSLNKKKFPDLKKKISNSESLFINKDQNSNRLRIEHLNMNYIRSKVLMFQKLILRLMLVVCLGDLRWWGSLTMVPAGIRLNTFRRSTIPQKQFINIIRLSFISLFRHLFGLICSFHTNLMI